MKSYKKLATGIALAAMVPLLAACGGGGGGDEAQGSESGGGESITIFQSKVEISDQLEALAQEYTDETGVEVEVIGTTGDDYPQQLQIRLNNGTGPSIFSLQSIEEAERLQSYIYDLSNEEIVQNIAPDMELSLGDKVIGIPYGVEGFGIVYNKDLVSPEDIQDYDSFVSTLQGLNDQGLNSFSLSQEAYFLIGHPSNYPFSIQEDHVEFIERLNNGEVTMAETEEFQEFGRYYDAIREYGPDPLSIAYDQQVGDFASGQTAMIHQGNWAYSMIEEFGADFEIGMAPFPLMGNDKLAVGVGSYWAVNAEKSEEEIQAATDFLDWLHTSETGQRYIVEEFGFIPAMTNIEANDLDPLSQAVFEASNSGNTIPWSHSYYPANLVPNDFTPAAQEFFTTPDMTSDEFIENLDAAWQNATQ